MGRKIGKGDQNWTKAMGKGVRTTAVATGQAVPSRSNPNPE